MTPVRATAKKTSAEDGRLVSATSNCYSGSSVVGNQLPENGDANENVAKKNSLCTDFFFPNLFENRRAPERREHGTRERGRCQRKKKKNFFLSFIATRLR